MKKLWLFFIVAFSLGSLMGCGTDNAADEQKQNVENKLNPGNDNPDYFTK